MIESNSTLQQLLERHAAGELVDVPDSLAEDFRQVIAADAELRKFLDATMLAEQYASTERIPPQLPDDFTITRELGQGGMGVVYLARQQSLSRNVAIKVLRPAHQKFQKLVDRFLHEAQHLAKLRHPHIVAIHEIGDAGGEPYFTMDYVDGEPLTQRLTRGPLPPSQALELFKQIASAVQHAHKHGIIYRDLKPANILLDQQGDAFVTDFGLARQLQQDSTLTQTGEVLGTPQYMSPEQARGETALVGEATDIHALGLILFEMLTGRPALEARSPADVLVKLLHQEPDSPRKLDHRIPRDLDTICLKCLQKNPPARYASVGALLEDIRRYEAGEPLQARRPSWVSLAIRWCARHWKLAATACVAALLAVLLVAPLFDRAYTDLVAWGDEELATGNVETAAQIYVRAWGKGTEAEQRELIGRVMQVCRMSDDPALSVDLAIRAIALDPTLSFGELDVLVAQTLVARERSTSPTGSLNIFQNRPSDALELIRKRLNLALQQQLRDDRRLELEETLTAVKLALGTERPNVRYAPDFLYELPSGTPDELLKISEATEQPIWNRAKAAISLGRHLESQRDKKEAVNAYRQAIKLLRLVYPFTDGIRAQLGAGKFDDDSAIAEECQLVSRLVADLHRLSPVESPRPTGGVSLSLAGVPLPDDVDFALRLELCAPEITDPDKGLPHQLPRLVLMENNRESIVQTLPGRYRLHVRGSQARWGKESDRFMRLLQLDSDHLPDEVTIANGVVKLPPARLRLADEVRLISPAHGSTLNLDKARFQWNEVSNATYYRVEFEYTTESPHPTSTIFAWIRSNQPHLQLNQLEAVDRKSIRENLLVGRTGGWSVTAFDNNDRQIGVSLEPHRFAVAQELSSE